MTNHAEVTEFFFANSVSPVSEAKLQILCAYAKAFALALLDAPLFAASLEMGKNGPIIHDFSMPGLKKDAQAVRTPFSDEELFVLETVGDYYGRYNETDLGTKARRDFPENLDDTAIRERFSENPVILAIKEAY